MARRALDAGADPARVAAQFRCLGCKQSPYPDAADAAYSGEPPKAARPFPEGLGPQLFALARAAAAEGPWPAAAELPLLLAAQALAHAGHAVGAWRDRGEWTRVGFWPHEAGDSAVASWAWGLLPGRNRQRVGGAVEGGWAFPGDAPLEGVFGLYA